MSNVLEQHQLLARDIRTSRALLNTLPMPVWLRGSDGRIIWVNAAYAAAAVAENETEVIEKQIELLDSRERRIVAKTLSSGQAYRDRVHIVAETHEIVRYYQAADIFVCTSRVESFPRVILEAMAFGLPVISTRVFGVVEQVREGVNAMLYEPGDVNTLVAHLTQAIGDDDLRNRMAGNSPHVLDTLNTFEEMAAAYGGIFREAGLVVGGHALPAQGRKDDAGAAYAENCRIDSVAYGAMFRVWRRARFFVTCGRRRNMGRFRSKRQPRPS